MSKKLKGIIIAAAAVVLAAGAIMLYLWTNRLTPMPAGTVGNTPGNMYNGGLICESDGLVYYSNPATGGTLWSMTPDEGNRKEVGAMVAQQITAGGDYICYYQPETRGSAGMSSVISSHGIYRTNRKGQKTYRVSQVYPFNMQLVGDRLYYLVGTEGEPEMHSTSIFDHNDDEIIARTQWNFADAQPDGTVLYGNYGSNRYLCRYYTGSGASDIIWQGDVWQPYYYNGYVYYTCPSEDYCLCRYGLDGDRTVEILTHDRVDCYNIAGGYIYYQRNSVDSPALMMMGLDGSNPQHVADGNYTHISVTSRYVYFRMFGDDTFMFHVPVGSTGYTPFTT